MSEMPSEDMTVVALLVRTVVDYINYNHHSTYIINYKYSHNL